MNELIFLRPYWLLALIPAGYLLWRLWHNQSQQSSWKGVIAKEFQPYLLKAEQTIHGSPFGLLGLGLIWFAAIIALAGPSFHSEPIATQKTQTGTVIVLDLSLSMFADDIQPNRLTRVQFKINDLLATYPEIRIGMVGYSGSAHIISPIADDNSILKNLLPHLNPLIMPSYGADAVAGFKLAHKLIEGAQVNQGHIIWITDDLETDEIDTIKNILTLNNISLSLLAVGTELGGAVNIPEHGLLKDQQDKLVRAAVPLNQLAQLSKQVGGQFAQLQLDNSDLPSLIPSYLAEQTEKEDQKILSQAIDYGVYALGFILLLAAFSLRKGWLTSIAWMLLLPGLVMPPPSFAETDNDLDSHKPEIKLSDRWQEIYMTDDQRGYQAWSNQDYIAAEREFANPAWRGAALYKQQKYQQAIKEFEQDPTANGHYNRGNAHAQLGELEAAKQAYQQALKLNPEFSQAQNNLALVEQQLNQQSSQQETSENGDQSEDNQPNKPDSQASTHEQNQQSDQDNQANSSLENEIKQQDSELTKPQEPQAELESDPHNQDKQNTQQKILEDDQHLQDDLLSDQEQLNEQAQREQEQADQAWLNQVQDRPGIFLQRKFDYQFKKNPPADPQENKSKIW